MGYKKRDDRGKGDNQDIEVEQKGEQKMEQKVEVLHSRVREQSEEKEKSRNNSQFRYVQRGFWEVFMERLFGCFDV